MGLQGKLQNAFERLPFKGKTSPKTKYLSFVFVNVFLMVVLFYLLLNTAAYNWTGHLYPAGSGFHLDTALDTAIPFVPEMVVFYVYLFYPLVILTMVFFAFVEYRKGYALGWSLVAINAIALAIYVVFPVSTFWYRQAILAHPIVNNFWATEVYNVFVNDTSFNCFPSLHAAVSTVCFYAWFRYTKDKPHLANKAVTVLALAIAVGVVLSTLFIKQHYIVDEVAGIMLAWIVGKILFDKLAKPRSAK